MRKRATPPFDVYLDAKRALDERSLHGPTWRAYLDFLRGKAVSGAVARRPPAVLELGCGSGSMLDRTIRALAPGDAPASGDVLASDNNLSYTAVDSSKELLEALRSRFGDRPASDGRIELETRCGDALGELETLTAEGRRFDAIVSHAFMDLADIPRLSAAAFAALVPNGVYYSSLVFDGITAFLSATEDDTETDEQYIAVYHRSMRRTWNGFPLPDGSRADGASGRRLLAHLTVRPWRIASAGPSDWIVLPRAEAAALGGAMTPSDDETVVAAMLGFFAESVGGELADPSRRGSELAAFQAWLDTKHDSLRRGELGFYAHNLDVLAVRRE